MQTYRSLLGVREFRALFVTQCLTMGAASVGSLALGTIIYSSPGSPVLSALAMFGGPLAGMLLGDIGVGRFLGQRIRDRLVEPLRILLAARGQVRRHLPVGRHRRRHHGGDLASCHRRPHARATPLSSRIISRRHG